MPSIPHPARDSALQQWRAACARLEQAIEETITSQSRPDNPVKDSFGVALRALYSLETAFFPDRVCPDGPEVAAKPERVRSKSPGAAKTKGASKDND